MAAGWAMPAYAAGESTRKPAASSEPNSGPTAFVDKFKATVDALKLSDESRRKADAFFEAARKELTNLNTTDAAELKKKAHETIERLRKDVGELLTTEQKLEIQKKLQGFGMGLMIDKIKQQIGNVEPKLTDEQKKQVEDLLDDTKHKLEELRAEAQNGAKDSGAKAAAVLKEMKVKLYKILSPEQLKGVGGDGAKPDGAAKK
jgi:F0F1-type ATP synthase membrane subunit b/b'